jgi:hypothetical protein
MPLESEAQNNPAGPPPVPAGITAAATPTVAAVPTSMNMFVVANATVLRALERAGKRLLDRHSRDRWPDVPAYELHTRIRVGGHEHASRLLDGAWDHLSVLAEVVDPQMNTEILQGALHEYCMTLLAQEQRHHVNLLGQYLCEQGILDARP